MTTAPPSSVRGGPARWLWFALGWCAVAIGSIGIVVPGLPTTVFFIVAASCFARSSPRFERWVLNLPRIGPLVRDYRAGLGMPRRAKAWAIGTMLAVGALSAYLAADNVVIATAIVVLILVGVWYVGWRVPTRERVEMASGREGPG
jgi:uncharacterized membrane protein YbaN (DUF454 family)